MEPTYFATPEDFRNWFLVNHLHEKELVVGYYKKGSKIQSIDWPQSVDQALCFGWIDGVRRSVDANRYSIRFTPRRKNSIWSSVNLKRIVELDEMGLLTDAGRKVWEERNPEKCEVYSFEQQSHGLSPQYEAQFQANADAWANFNRMIPSYKKPAMWWVMSAKQVATQEKRLAILIECSEANRKIPSLRRRPEE
ncbi:MAG: hypothetical protein RLZZ519_192 [Bacteroidota bacterium]|jgi:uncharacterized protein YdeI (YjbR/CyaY-like superfamily)